jgi:hypothetical protein
MAGRSLVGGIALAVLMAASAGARAEEAGRCAIGGKYNVHTVAAYTTFEDAGYTTYRSFRGAEVFVPAEPGLTREWLQRELADQIAAGDCNFGIKNARVTVMSAGGGFSVQITGNNEKEAGVILEHAQLLVK